jgi:hypothetical protein
MRRSVPEVVAAIAAGLTIMSYPIIGLLRRLVFRLMLRSPGPFVVSPREAKIFLGGEELASFDELGVPRFANHLLTYEDEQGEERQRRWPVVVVHRESGDDLLLFDDPVMVSWKVLNRMDEIADHINAILAEYHQRRAVERWLAEREAEQGKQRIYR